jgi:CDGSH-type Zn-finger protein
LNQGSQGTASAVHPKDAVVITPYRDGPLLVRGDFRLLDGAGNVIECRRQTVALCRCGKSRNRPFCDGTHKLTGFRADGPAQRGSRAPAPPEKDGGADPPAQTASAALD